MAKRDRGTGRELLAIDATTEKVFVTYVLEIGHHGTEVEDSQDALKQESRQILCTIGL